MRTTSLAIALVIASLSRSAVAQESPRAATFSAGLGVAAADRQNGVEVPGTGEGGWLTGEYVFRGIHWFTPRLYAGILLSWPQENCGLGVTPCDVSARIAFAGAKFRLMAPIPWVGPFFELGVGGSAGRIATRSGYDVDVVHNGLMVHVPLTLGLALGRSHQFDVAFTYLFHPAEHQICGALALGTTIDL